MGEAKFNICYDLLTMRGLDKRAAELLRTTVTEPILIGMFTLSCEEFHDSEFMMSKRECLKEYNYRWEKDAQQLVLSLNQFVPYAAKCIDHPLSSECLIWKEALAKLPAVNY